MGRNLKYQFLNAINNCFKEGMDKHSIKASGQMDGTRIFSYADRKNLVDTASNFSNYLKSNYPDVKMLKDIKPEHVQSFLNSKSGSCSDATLKQYQNKFNKLQNVVNNTYNINVNFKGAIAPHGSNATKIRNSSMSKIDFKKLENSFSNSKSSAKTAIQITAKAGLRVGECVKLKGKDINIQGGTVHVHGGKGGRDRDVKIRPEDKKFWSDLKASVRANERICPVNKDSINKAIRREMEKLDIQDKYRDTGIHCIRKMYAQQQFDHYREQGMEIKEALGQVSEDLGHSDTRIELMKEYVLNIY